MHRCAYFRSGVARPVALVEQPGSHLFGQVGEERHARRLLDRPRRGHEAAPGPVVHQRDHVGEVQGDHGCIALK